MKNRYNRKSKILGGANNSNAPPPAANAPPAGNNAPPSSNAPPPGNNTPPPGNNTTANVPAKVPANTPSNTPANTPANTSSNNTSSNSSPGNSNSLSNISSAVNIASNSVMKMASNATEFVENISKNISKNGRAAAGKVDFSSVNKYLIILFIGIVFILLIVFAKYMVVKYAGYVDSSPYLIKGTKSAKHSVVINQDPESINYIQIRRSENEDGMEFTYSLWMLIELQD